MKQPFWDIDSLGYEELVPLDQLNPWNQVFVAGRQLPGYCEVKGDGLELNVDIQKAKGTQGTTVRFHGDKESKFTIDLMMYNQDHWDQFQDMLPLLITKGNKKDPTPQAIVHPGLNAYGIDRAVFLKVPIPEKSDIGRKISIECLFWTGNPKKVGTTKPTAAATKPPPTVLNDRERAWADEYQNRSGQSVPAERIPPPPPSFLDARPDVP